jgi:hypothetical protein
VSHDLTPDRLAPISFTVAVLWSDLISQLLEPILSAQGSQDDATTGDTDINLDPSAKPVSKLNALGILIPKLLPHFEIRARI